MLIKRTSTPLTQAASRANGARSRGPVTAPGKANSSRNGLRHGFFVKGALLPDESNREFLVLRAEFFAELRPSTPQQSALVNDLVESLWALNRCHVIHDRIVTAELRHQFPAVTAFTAEHHAAAVAELCRRSRLLDHIGYAESRQQRRLESAFRGLAQLRGEKKSTSRPGIAVKTDDLPKRGPENLRILAPAQVTYR